MEREILNKIAQLIADLKNEHCQTALLSLESDDGLLVIGAENVKQKMERSYRCQCDCRCPEENVRTWADAFYADRRELINRRLNFRTDDRGISRRLKK